MTVDKTFVESGLEETYSFVHLTLQEYLAAYHISQLSKEQTLTLFNDCGELPQMAVVWKFYCGITGLEKEHQLEVFKTMAAQSQEHCLYLLQCAYESQSKECVRALMESNDGIINIQRDTLLPTDLLALAFALNNCGDHLRGLKFFFCTINEEGYKVLLDNIRDLPQLKSLR